MRNPQPQPSRATRRRGAAAICLSAATWVVLGGLAAAQEPRGRETQFIRIEPLPASDRPGSETAPPVARKSAAKPTSSSSNVSLKTLAKAGGLAYRMGFVRGVGVHVIDVNMRDPRVKSGVMLARGGVGSTESFASMVGRARPTAAITGTFFGLNNLEPTGDIVIEGRPAWRGFIGTAVAITKNNRVAFVPTRYKDTRVDWSRYETVIRGGPALLREREFVVAPQDEGFFSLGEFDRHWRTAIGATAENHLVVLAVRQRITLWELAKIMYSLGCWDAVTLDGGTSTALSFGSTVIARPGRSLTNLMVFYADRAQYEAMRPQLIGTRAAQAPGATPILAPSSAQGADAFGTGFEPAMPDPARPTGQPGRLRIQIEPATGSRGSGQ